MGVNVRFQELETYTPKEGGDMETVGFIGLGNMGAGMANNIQKAGYPMVVFDIQEAATRQFLEAGARLASSPAEGSQSLRGDIYLPARA